MNWDKLDQKLRERLIRDNPRDIGPAGLLPRTVNSLGAIPDQKPKPNPVSALELQSKARKRSKRGVAVIVTLISFRRALLDGDNLQGSCKGLRDAIARSLSLNDADYRLKWQYEQVQSAGSPGVLVMIETKARR